MLKETVALEIPKHISAVVTVVIVIILVAVVY